MTLKWLQEVEKKMGVWPIIYTREQIRDKHLNDSRFNSYRFWIANYSEKGPSNGNWQFWQKTEKGSVNGHDGYIDFDLFRGDYETFISFLESLYLREIYYILQI